MVKLSDIYKSPDDKEVEIRQPIQEKMSSKPDSSSAEEIYNNALLLSKSKIDQVRAIGRLDIEDSTIKTIGALLQIVNADKKTMLKLFYENTSPNYLYAHSVNVCILTLILAKGMVLNQDQLITLSLASFFHDIGLSKESELINTEKELEYHERLEKTDRHPEKGRDLILGMNNIDGDLKNGIAKIVFQHHEKEDGSGYPEGLKGNEISNYARLLAVSDIYEALTHHRANRPAINPAKAIDIILGNKGKEIAVSSVKMLVDELTLFPIGSRVKLNDGRIAIVTDVKPEYPISPKVNIWDKDTNTVGDEVVDLSRNKLFSVEEVL